MSSYTHFHILNRSPSADGRGLEEGGPAGHLGLSSGSGSGEVGLTRKVDLALSEDGGRGESQRL